MIMPRYLVCMETEQCPALARGMASSKTSIERLSQAIVSMFRLASVFVHFHSFSCVATWSSGDEEEEEDRPFFSTFFSGL